MRYYDATKAACPILGPRYPTGPKGPLRCHRLECSEEPVRLERLQWFIESEEPDDIKLPQGFEGRYQARKPVALKEPQGSVRRVRSAL